jgi:hypothetical protein
LTFDFRSPTVTFSAQNRSSTTEYYCIVVNYARQWLMLALSIVEGLALSGLCEGFARGWAYLHTACPERSRRACPERSRRACPERSRRAQLLVPKNLAVKPCISITSKLIENKTLQVLYFGHLRKTGGRGGWSYQSRSYSWECHSPEWRSQGALRLANLEIHPAKPTGWSRVGVPRSGQYVWPIVSSPPPHRSLATGH